MCTLCAPPLVQEADAESEETLEMLQGLEGMSSPDDDDEDDLVQERRAEPRRRAGPRG